MKDIAQRETFRLAAVLYADNNYEISSRTIHRKVVESVFLETENRVLTVDQIIDFISLNYRMEFAESEVTTILKRYETDGFVYNQTTTISWACLSEKRLKTLQSKINNKTIDFFIESYFEFASVNMEAVDFKYLIYSFLYEVFSTNVASIAKLISGKSEFGDLIGVHSGKFSESQKIEINNFLTWDNDGKNKSIFDIASYALEYCMITNIGKSNSIQLQQLKRKVFYLDTNVLFRAIGINGVGRMEKTRTLLRKFLEIGEELRISRFTLEEFKESIAFHIDKVKKYRIRNVDASVYENINMERSQDILNLFHSWRIGKVNDNYDLFEAHILSSFAELKAEFKISEDHLLPFDLSDDATKEKIGELSRSISTAKDAEDARHSYLTDDTDACNLLLLEARRGSNHLNLSDTKYFFLSTDQALRRWDYYRHSHTPIVILPSQWLSIILRLVNRTTDDFKSFVSFINLPVSDSSIPSEKMHIVLAGIGEMTQNVEYQRHLIDVLIQNNFDELFEKDLDNDIVFEKTKTLSKSILESELEQLKVDQKQLVNNLAKTNETANSALARVAELEQSSAQKEILIESKEDRLIRTQEALINEKAQNQLWRWRLGAFLLLLLPTILLAGYLVLFFFFVDYEWNIVSSILDSIEKITNSVRKNTLSTLIYAPFSATIPMVLFAYNRFFSKKKRDEKLNEFREIVRKNSFDEN